MTAFIKDNRRVRVHDETSDSMFVSGRVGFELSLKLVKLPRPERRGQPPDLNTIETLGSYVHMPLLPFLPYLEKLKTESPHTEYSYQQPDEQWISLGPLQIWIKSCDAYHSEHCQSPSTLNTAKPLWVIDVERSCLVLGEHIHRYVSLSYVWSRAEATSTTLSNLQAHQEEGALTSASVILPKTVAHAMGLTRLFGETYLWVDRLCIVQDDASTKSTQINSMAEIYANSYFTIVAAQGKDADAGLRGIAGVTPPRVLSDKPSSMPVLSDRPSMYRTNSMEQSPDSAYRPDAPSSNDQRALAYQNHYEAISTQAKRLMRTNWYTRGWTFQEYLFSRRKLVFHDNTVNWECHCSAWYENQHIPVVNSPCKRKQPSNNMGFDTTPWPDFYRYARLVALYNQRSLTFPEDVLNAFAGVTSVLGPSFDGGFIYGLPQMFFDSALLWQPYRPLKRREAVRDHASVLPSWSWIGWRGDLHSESWRSGYDYLRGNPEEEVESDAEGRESRAPITWRTESCVEWFYSESLDSRKYPIVVSSQRFRDNDPGELPAGWNVVSPEQGRAYYTHISDRSQGFWYPIPVNPSSPTPLCQPRFLHALTRRGTLTLGPTFTNRAASDCLSCDLVAADGTWAGCLRLNIEYDSSSRNFAEGRQCQLVQLSLAEVADKEAEKVCFDEWDREGCKKERESGGYRFVNVVWVEERKGVVFRRALGRVLRGAWDGVAGGLVGVVFG